MRLMGALVVCGILLVGTAPDSAVTAKTASYQRASYVIPPDVKASGFTFADTRIPLDRREVTERIVEQVNYLLMDRRAGMMEWFDRMAVFGPMIKAVLVDEKVSEDLIYLCALLSEMLPNAKTRAGGVGWWALGPGRSKNDSPAIQWVTTNDWDDRRDPVISARIAARILRRMFQRNDNDDWLCAIAAFLDGSDAVEAIVKKSPGFSFWDLAMPPYSEHMIPRLIALKLIDTHRDSYTVEIPRLSPLGYDCLDQLKLAKDLPLHVVAKWCDTNPRNMWELNPGVDPSSGVLPKADKRSLTGFPLRVPKGKGPLVQRMLVNEGYLGK